MSSGVAILDILENLPPAAFVVIIAACIILMIYIIKYLHRYLKSETNKPTLIERSVEPGSIYRGQSLRYTKRSDYIKQLERKIK